MRIKDGLTAYSTSSIQGNIRRGDGDIAFRRLLGQCGVVLIPEKHTLSIELARELLSNRPLLDLYRSLCNGTPLPTDNATVAHQVLKDLLEQIQQYGIALC